MRSQGVAAAPLSVAEHVDEVQVSRHQWLQQSLASTRQADAPLVHVQRLGAKTDLVLVHELLGVGRATAARPILMGRGLAVFSCVASRAARAGATGRLKGSEPAETLQKRAAKAV